MKSFALPKELNELKKFDNWVCYRLVPRPTKADPNHLGKVPYNPATGETASAADPRTWADFETAKRAFDCGRYRYDGIGFELGNSGYCGIDLDHCVDGNQIKGEVANIINRIGCYTEYSISGTGIHIWAKSAPLEKTGYDGPTKKNCDIDLEVYRPTEKKGGKFAGEVDGGRFLTISGNVCNPLPIADRTVEIASLVREYWPPEESEEPKEPAKSKPSAITTTPDASNKMLLSALDAIDPANLDFDNWAAIMSAMKACGFTADDAENWSGKNGNPKHVPGYVYKRWNKFHLPGGNDAGAEGVIINRAKQSGWKPADAFTSEELREYARQANPDVKTDFGNEKFTGGGTALADVRPSTSSALKYRPANDDLTDAGNAEMFARMNRDRLRWCAALGWLAWTGKQWEVDDQAAARAALDFSKAMLDEAMQFYMTAPVIPGNKENPEAKAYFRHAVKLRSTAAQLNMLTLAKARMVIRAHELDADPEILNTVAGIVNLRTGAIGPHDPKRFCTMLAPAAPANDGAEMWDNFLDLVTCGDGDLKSYLQRVAGMAVVGKVYEEGIQITIGGGRNGKSTFYGALSKVLGDYAGTIDPDVLMVKKNTSRFELSNLRGKRLVLCSELEAGQRLSIKALKRISSRDPINIERKYKDQEQVTPTHTTIMHTNVLPIVGDARDGATWRRLTVIPFNATMPEGNKDIKAYDDVLMKNAGGAILQWMIDGAKLYLEAGGNLGDLPAAVLAATKQYREHEDWLQPFLDECCKFGSGQAQAIELFTEYQAFSARRGDRYTRKGREFYDAINEAFTSMGLIRKEPGRKVTWYGVSVIHAYSAADFAQPLTGESVDQDFDPLS